MSLRLLLAWLDKERHIFLYMNNDSIRMLDGCANSFDETGRRMICKTTLCNLLACKLKQKNGSFVINNGFVLLVYYVARGIPAYFIRRRTCK